MEIQYKRPDGTFVVLLNGNPYHVTHDDPLYEAASDLGVDAQFEPVAPEPGPAAVLAAWRANARCSRMQGILALGQTRWATVLEYRATATWSEVVVIDDARDWFRNSETIQLFGWLLNLTDTDIDALFIAAAAITA
jgi:hypothetical protein